MSNEEQPNMFDVMRNVELKIKDMQAGTKIDQPLFVSGCNPGVTQQGKPYLNLQFRDETGTLNAKLWDVSEQQRQVVKINTVVQVKADVLNYRDHLQLKVLDVALIADQSQFDMSRFMLRGPQPVETLRQIISEAIASIDNYEIKTIVSAIYKEYDQAIYDMPAAAKNHHEYHGGLATHICEMLQLGDAICALYPQLDHDLLAGGILLHDIGKVKELTSGAATEYTSEGNLLGHISISQTLVADMAVKLDMDPDSETLVLLRHMILSHHGAYEFGSPVLPMTIEAEALHFIDDFDARMVMMDKALKTVTPGQFSDKIFALDNRRIYKPQNH